MKPHMGAGLVDHHRLLAPTNRPAGMRLMTTGGRHRLSSRTGVTTTHSITRQVTHSAAEPQVGGGLGIIGCPATCVHAALGVAIGAHSAPWLGTDQSPEAGMLAVM